MCGLIEGIADQVLLLKCIRNRAASRHLLALYVCVCVCMCMCVCVLVSIEARAGAALERS